MTQDIKGLVDNVSRLSKKEQYHVLLILQKHNIEHTKNANGFFFNMIHLTPEIYQEIRTCLKLILLNRNLIQDQELRREKMYKSFKDIVESRLLTTEAKLRSEYYDNLKIKAVANIKCEICRVYKFKRNLNADPDDLIKEYQKSKRIPKSSIFAKLESKMRQIKSKSVHKQYKQTSAPSEKDDIHSDVFVDEIISDGIEADEYENVDNLDEISEVSEISESIESEVSDTSSHHEDFQKNYEFYKDILHKRGFVFSEATNELITLQDYIT